MKVFVFLVKGGSNNCLSYESQPHFQPLSINGEGSEKKLLLPSPFMDRGWG